MDNETFCRYSVAATIAFGLLAMFGLLLAGIAFGDLQVVVYALASVAASYLAQLVNTYAVVLRNERLNAVGYGLMLVAWASFGLGLLTL